MQNDNLLNIWWDLYGLGLKDTPTRGLLCELLFKELLSPEISRRLVKGAFVGQNSTASSYDWLLLKPSFNLQDKQNKLCLSDIPFGVFEQKDVAAIIEIKGGHYVGVEALEGYLDNLDRISYPLPWIYVNFSGSKTFYEKYLYGDLSFLNGKINFKNGKVYCLSALPGSGNKDENKRIQINQISAGLKEINIYIESLK